jgi:hypothetical protein
MTLIPNKIKFATSATTGTIKVGNFILGINDSITYGPTSVTGFYQGLSPVFSGYTVYQNKVSGGPSTFRPNNDSEFIGLAKALGGTNVTGVTDGLVYLNSQSSIIAVNRDYEDIVTSGLTLNLDAGFTPSYRRSGTTWTDLSFSGNNGALTNGPTYSSTNGGSIVFDGVDDYVVTPSFGLSSATSCLTFNFWIKPSGQTSVIQTILGKDTNTGNVPHILIGRSANSDTLRWNFNNGTGSAILSFLNFFTGYDNTWVNIQIVADYSLDIVTLYRNGTQFGQQSQPSAVFPNTDTIMYLSSFAINAFLVFKGNISISQIYNRSLSATEVLQNYNAQKSRFGL